MHEACELSSIRRVWFSEALRPTASSVTGQVRVLALADVGLQHSCLGAFFADNQCSRVGDDVGASCDIDDIEGPVEGGPGCEVYQDAFEALGCIESNEGLIIKGCQIPEVLFNKVGPDFGSPVQRQNGQPWRESVGSDAADEPVVDKCDCGGFRVRPFLGVGGCFAGPW